MSWMWKSTFQYFFIYRYLGGSFVATVLLCAISIHQCISDRSQASSSGVFPFPPLHFPSLLKSQRLYQESWGVDKARARLSRATVPVGKIKSIWFKLLVLLVIFKLLGSQLWESTDPIARWIIPRDPVQTFRGTYLEEADSQNHRHNTTFNAHIYSLCTKHKEKGIGPGEGQGNFYFMPWNYIWQRCVYLWTE